MKDFDDINEASLSLFTLLDPKVGKNSALLKRSLLYLPSKYLHFPCLCHLLNQIFVNSSMQKKKLAHGQKWAYFKTISQATVGEGWSMVMICK